MVAELQPSYPHFWQKTKEKNKEVNFTFIVNDNKVYHSLEDFNSTEAKKLFKEQERMKKDFYILEKELNELREKYIKSNQSIKKSMEPGILDKERRLENLRKEIDVISNKIRNKELGLQ